MTEIQIMVIVAAALVFKTVLNIGTGYYWRPKFQTLSRLLNTSVEYTFPILPIIMRINGQYKNRAVSCSFNAMFFASSGTITIAMLPLRELPKEPAFMVSYKKPTENTSRQGNKIIYAITTGTAELREYTEVDFTAILDELTEATEKMEQTHL